MIDDQKVLAIIPARGGSKRLPGKNLLELSGKPLIEWTLEAAVNSKYVDNVIVSTEDAEITEAVRLHGKYLIHDRPKELATDTARIAQVVESLIKSMQQKNQSYGYLLILPPTTPFRTSTHIDASVELLMEKNADSIVSVCDVGFPVEWTGVIGDDCLMDDFIKDIGNVQSQKCEKRKRLNGAIYLLKTSRFLVETTLLLSSRVFSFEMSRMHSIDIDDEEDFILAEAVARYNENIGSDNV